MLEKVNERSEAEGLIKPVPQSNRGVGESTKKICFGFLYRHANYRSRSGLKELRESGKFIF